MVLKGRRLLLVAIMAWGSCRMSPTKRGWDIFLQNNLLELPCLWDIYDVFSEFLGQNVVPSMLYISPASQSNATKCRVPMALIGVHRNTFGAMEGPFSRSSSTRLTRVHRKHLRISYQDSTVVPCLSSGSRESWRRDPSAQGSKGPKGAGTRYNIYKFLSINTCS